MAADFADGHSLDTDALQGSLHVVELERLNDGFDLLHFSNPFRYWVTASRTRADSSWFRSPAIFRRADSRTSSSYASGGSVMLTFRKSPFSPRGGFASRIMVRSSA